MRLRLAAALVVAAPVVLALGSDHLDGAQGLLVTSTLAGALLTGGLAVQPLLVACGSVREHRMLGTALVALAAGHVGALFLLAPDDALFAMSPDGPTRARMALIALVALLLAALLAAVGPRTRWDRRTWRLVHAYLGLVVVVLGVGHAVLTDGALDDAGTPLLLGLGALGAAGIATAVGRGALGRRGRRAEPSAPR